MLPREALLKRLNRAGSVRKKPVGRYTYLRLLGDGDVVPCIVDIFQIEIKESRAEFKERGERTIAWVSPDEAARRVREVELKSLLVEFKPHGHPTPRPKNPNQISVGNRTPRRPL